MFAVTNPNGAIPAGLPNRIPSLEEARKVAQEAANRTRKPMTITSWLTMEQETVSPSEGSAFKVDGRWK